MIEDIRKSWLSGGRWRARLQRGFHHAYETVKVDPSKFLRNCRLRMVPLTTFHGLYSVEMSVLDDVAERVIRSGTKVAAAEGAGFGLGGIMTIVPDLSILAGITMRTIQKLSLVYGFEYNNEEETAELWIAAASAAGVDISRDLLEKEVINNFVPRVIQRIAAQTSKEIVEKWAGRLIPLASSVIGAGLNYYFVRAWGERARKHFRERHLAGSKAHVSCPGPSNSTARRHSFVNSTYCHAERSRLPLAKVRRNIGFLARFRSTRAGKTFICSPVPFLNNANFQMFCNPL